MPESRESSCSRESCSPASRSASREQRRRRDHRSDVHRRGPRGRHRSLSLPRRGDSRSRSRSFERGVYGRLRDKHERDHERSSRPIRGERSPQKHDSRRAPEPMSSHVLPPSGAILLGKVVSLRPFGAFVALDGYHKHGLIHISQLAKHRVENVEAVVSEGQAVKVKVLPGDNPEKISLSLRQVDQLTGEDLGDEAPPRRQKQGANGGDDVIPRNSDGSYMWGKLEPLEREKEKEEELVIPKAQPNFARTGKLAEESNKVNGVVLKWSEPPDAMKPSKHWRLYVFKGKESLEPYHVHRQTAYLMGRERRVCDIPLDHPSCSSQHAVIQFRLTSKTDSSGKTSKHVRPYLMDLGSTNGSFINGERIDAQKYVELLPQDVLRFGYSSREYVVINADEAT